MKNYLFKMRYDGYFFHGWQMQKNENTVQGALTEAFESIFNEKITIYGCSRTDSGVHANEFCFNAKLKTDMSNARIIQAVNSKLPQYAKIYECFVVSPTFHARYDCKGKQYLYYIYNEKYPNPFFENRALFYPYEIDVNLLNEQAKYFIGTHDFSSFCASGSTVQSNVRTVFDSGVKRNEDTVIFYVSADGFLYNMVRIMVGTLLDINRGKIAPNTIPDIIEKKSRYEAGVTASPSGLYLNKVFYEEDIYEKEE